MSSSPQVRLGVIGAGIIGKIHLANFQQLPNVTVVGVADTYADIAEEAARQFGVARAYSAPDELIADPDIDAVIIGVPNRHHAPLTLAALEAGKHVYLEKPMAINGMAAKAIARAQKATGKIVLIGHQMRWEHNALQIKEQIDKGALGRIYNAKAGWWRRKGIPGWGTWFTRMEESGGGPLIDIGVHMLDLALWLMGNPKPIAVYGSVYAEFGPRKRGIGTWGRPDWNGRFDVEDLATALIRMEDGSMLSLEVSWAASLDTDDQPFVHLMGSEGGVSMHGNEAKLLTEHFERPVEVPIALAASDEGARLRLARHFIDCIHGIVTPSSDATSGLTNNLILDAIYASSRNRREVILDYTL